MKNIKYLTAALIVSSLALNAAGVQTPKIGDAIRLGKQPKDVTKPTKKKAIIVKGIKHIQKPTKKSDKYAKTIFIKSFKIKGNIHIKSKLLLALISSYANKRLSFYNMQSVATTITKEYRKQGYLVARAYIPAQSMRVMVS